MQPGKGADNCRILTLTDKGGDWSGAGSLISTIALLAIYDEKGDDSSSQGHPRLQDEQFV